MAETGAQLGPYRLLRRIGAGGMAEVFLAQRIGAEGFARTVAIKTILAVGAEEEGVTLFLDEARVASYLEHAAIVQTVDLGFEDDTLFIAMDYVPGPALSRIIRDLKKAGRVLPPHVVAHVGARVASALDYAHRRATAPDGRPLALVHRDVTPQNILLTRDGLVKLTDFGVARASVQTHRTRTGQVRGKAAYMAPEQVRAGALDGRTDVFALGLVLYEAATALRVYQRSTDIMSMRAILTDEVPPVRTTRTDVPEDLARVIEKALAKQPEERWQTAQEMSEALQRVHRTHAVALIETEIKALIDELFGPEQFAATPEAMPVEAWQPTIRAPAEGGGALQPHRMSQLSPKIAALLRAPDDGRREARGDLTPGTGGRRPTGDLAGQPARTSTGDLVRPTGRPATGDLAAQSAATVMGDLAGAGAAHREREASALGPTQTGALAPEDPRSGAGANLGGARASGPASPTQGEHWMPAAGLQGLHTLTPGSFSYPTMSATHDGTPPFPAAGSGSGAWKLGLAATAVVLALGASAAWALWPDPDPAPAVPTTTVARPAATAVAAEHQAPPTAPALPRVADAPEPRPASQPPTHRERPHGHAAARRVDDAHAPAEPAAGEAPRADEARSMDRFQAEAERAKSQLEDGPLKQKLTHAIVNAALGQVTTEDEDALREAKKRLAERRPQQP